MESTSMNDDLLTRLRVTEEALARVEAKAGWINGAFKNRAYANGIATTAALLVSPTAAQSLVMAGAMLNAVASGIFFCSITASITAGAGLAGADTITHTISSFTTAANTMTLGTATGTQVGPGTASRTAGQKTNGVWVNNVAGGIVPTGTAGTLVQHSSGAQIYPAVGLSSVFSWQGIIHNSITATTETPFTVGNPGNQVLVTWAVNLSAHAIAIAGFSMELYELP